jgi:hypothetical protein
MTHLRHGHHAKSSNYKIAATSCSHPGALNPSILRAKYRSWAISGVRRKTSPKPSCMSRVMISRGRCRDFQGSPNSARRLTDSIAIARSCPASSSSGGANEMTISLPPGSDEETQQVFRQSSAQYIAGRQARIRNFTHEVRRSIHCFERSACRTACTRFH